MPERPGKNPYSRPVSPGDGSAPNPAHEQIWSNYNRYAVRDAPDSSDPSYVDGAYSTELATTGSPAGTPDDIRIGVREAPPNSPQDGRVYRRRFAEFFKRAQGDQNTLAGKGKQEKPPAPNVPLWTQERLPIRPRATDAPAGNQFRRPEHRPRNIKDAVGEHAVQHFSLADHRRTFEILGQQPRGGVGVNTYRVPVRPWDENNFIPPTPQSSLSTLFNTRPTYRAGGNQNGRG
jgi:hypothetical protein